MKTSKNKYKEEVVNSEDIEAGGSNRNRRLARGVLPKKQFSNDQTSINIDKQPKADIDLSSEEDQ